MNDERTAAPPTTDGTSSEAPALAPSADQLAVLTAEQRRVLLEQLLARKAAAGDETSVGAAGDQAGASAGTSSGTSPGISTGPAGRGAPLSFSQRRIWNLSQIRPDDPAYNISIAVQMTGSLNEAALHQALDEIVRRHHVLRAVLTADAHGEPSQRAAAPAPVPLERVDLRSLAENERYGEAVRLARETLLRPFDLESGSLLRGDLLRLAEDRYILALATNQVAFDGQSRRVLIDELTGLYQAFADGSAGSEAAAVLEELPMQYVDFAAWQRRTLEGEPLRAQLRYWRERLAGGIPRLALPVDRPRTGDLSASVAQAFTIPAEASERLRALAKKERVSLFTVLLAALKTLLARITGQDDVLVFSSSAGRGRPELQRLIGLFANLLTLRTSLADDPSFQELLHRVDEVVRGAYAHQDLPFEQVVESLQVGSSPDAAPRFQVMFMFWYEPLPSPDLPGLKVEPIDLDAQPTKFDLRLYMVDTRPELSGELRFRTGVFAPETAATLLRQLECLLVAAAAAPETRLGELPLMDATELAGIVATSHGPVYELPAESLDRLVRHRIALDPEAVAVIGDDEEPGHLHQLTYGELGRLADRLARELHARGVGPEVPVPLLLDRSVARVVAVLAVLAAGGACVPLEPEWPRAWIHAILADLAGAAGPPNAGPSSAGRPVPVVLTRGALLEKRLEAGLKGLDLPGTLDLDELLGAAACAAEPGGSGEPFEPPAEARPSARTLAYVAYEPDGEANPRGVAVEHGGLVNLVMAQTEICHLEPGSRMLQFAAPGLDASITETLSALAAGAVLCLGSREQLVPGAGLVEAIQDLEIDTVVLPSTLLAMMEPASVPGLRTVIAAGERCPGDVARTWCEGRRFAGATGSPETTASALVREQAGERPWLPAGRPIANTRAMVLDDQMRPTAVGVLGELYVGGAAVARGYWGAGAPGRFVPDPSSSDGGRLVRTGDRARLLPDGGIELLGRVDRRAALVGYQVEPGAVETVLEADPAIAEAAVVAGVSGRGVPQLVGHLVVDVSGAAEQIRQNLAGPDAARAHAETVAGRRRIWDRTVATTHQRAECIPPEIDIEAVAELTARLDRAAVAHICNALIELELFSTAGETWPVDEILEQRAIETRFRKTVLKWLEILAEDRLLERLDRTTFRCPAPLTPASAEEADGLAAGEDPAHAEDSAPAEDPVIVGGGPADLILNCAKHLVPVVRGKVDPLELLFPGGAWKVAESVYANNPEAVYFNSLVAGAFASILEAWPAGEPFHAIEVGAGVGATASLVLPMLAELPSGQATYTYTDLSNFFLDGARERHGSNPAARFGILDIERDPGPQGYEPGTYHVVVASIVLHATRDISESLLHLRSLLAPGGIVLVLEPTTNPRGEAVSVRLLEGYNRFEDDRVTANDPNLDVATWRTKIEAAGFVETAVFPHEDLCLEMSKRHFIMGLASAATEVRDDDLREHLRQQLPGYFVPAAFIRHARLPRMADGSLDYPALAAFSEHGSSLTASFVAPDTPTEERLAGIWAEVLGADTLGVESDFFELGGDSLLATRIISRIRSDLGVEIPMRRLFEVPTIRAMASHVDAHRRVVERLQKAREQAQLDQGERQEGEL